MRSKLLLISSLLFLLVSCTQTYIVTFSGSTGGTVSDTGGEYDEGTTVSVTARPDAEYEFVSWSNGSTQNPITITVSESISLTATFKKVEYEVSTNVIGQGTIKEEVLIQGGRYTSGTKLRLTALPDEGWEFDSWSGSVVSSQNPLVVDVNAAKDIVVNFIRKNPLYIAENGVTIKAEDYAQVGDIWELNGEDYLIVDEAMLRQMVADNMDVTRVVTSKVTNMRRLFIDKPGFNQDIGNWDTSAVRDMALMFTNSNSDERGVFNRDIGSWDVGLVNDMMLMFLGQSMFNQDIGNWNTTNVESMNSMFAYAFVFDQDLNDWNTSNVTDMSFMFYEAKMFNGDISMWDVSNVKSIGSMFQRAESFNQYIGDWTISSLTEMNSLFQDAKSFNQNIQKWDISKVMTLDRVFKNASSFNQPLNDWNVIGVTSMNELFRDAYKFNQDLSSWDVSNVVSMSFMFTGASSFNQDLSGWVVDQVNVCHWLQRDTYSWILPKPEFKNCNSF